MMVLKRKEIVATALVLLIGMAGYLNWSYQDTIKVRDGESYTEAGKKLGEAQWVNSQTTQEEQPAEETWGKKTDEEKSQETSEQQVQSTEVGSNYFEAANLEKQNSRAKSLEILNQTAANESFDSEIRKKAQEQILLTAKMVEGETAVENIAKAKGYTNICVYVNEETVNITVKKEGFSDADVVKLQEIATEQLKISQNNIKVVEVK